MSACAWTARFTTCPKNLSWQRRKSTTSRSLLTVLSSVRMPAGASRIRWRPPRRCPAALSSRMLSAVNRSRSRRTMPATTAAFPSKSLPRECSHSTTRMARARCAPVWASRSALTRTASFRTATFPSSRALSARPAGGVPTRAASRRCTTTHSAKSTALRWKRPSRSSPSRHSTSCCTAPEMSRSSCRSAAFRAA